MTRDPRKRERRKEQRRVRFDRRTRDRRRATYCGTVDPSHQAAASVHYYAS